MFWPVEMVLGLCFDLTLHDAHQHFWNFHSSEIINMIVPNFEVLSLLFKDTVYYLETFEVFFCQTRQYFAWWGVQPPHMSNETWLTGNAVTLLFTDLNFNCVKSYVLYV